MKKILVVLVVLFGIINLASANGVSNKYQVNDTELTQEFNSAQKIEISNLDFGALNAPATMYYKQKDAAIATLICWLVGGFGIHRHYLGTKSNMWATYTFTCCGIFGIVPLVDFFVLLIDGVINDKVDKYIDNEDFFMW